MGDGSSHADREAERVLGAIGDGGPGIKRAPAPSQDWLRQRAQAEDRAAAGLAASGGRGGAYPGPTPPDLADVMRQQRSLRLEILPDADPSIALTNVSTYPAAYRICAAHEGGYFVTIESAGPPRLFGQVVFAGNLDDCLAYLGRKLSPGDSATTEETPS